MTMSDVKKKLSKEEKMEKAKRLMAKMNDLELSPAELENLAAGGCGEMFCGMSAPGGGTNPG